MFREVHVVLPSQDVTQSIRFYDKLGFKPQFADSRENPTYAGVRRDNVELHLQWHDAKEWAAVERPSVRFLVEDVDVLFAEFSSNGLVSSDHGVRATSWGTREFAFFDPFNNGLTFYQDL